MSRLDLRSAFNGGKARAVQFFDGLKRVINPEKIKKIDLSSNAINVNGDDQATEILASFLSSFPCLRKVDLRGNRLTNKVGCILKNCENLEYLNLSGCQMRQIDVSFLSSLQKLTHLDISNNYLGTEMKTGFFRMKKLTCCCQVMIVSHNLSLTLSGGHHFPFVCGMDFALNKRNPKGLGYHS